jgi:hypothetical protein
MLNTSTTPHVSKYQNEKYGPHASNLENFSCQQTTVLIQSHSNRLPILQARVTATSIAVTERGQKHAKCRWLCSSIHARTSKRRI